MISDSTFNILKDKYQTTAINIRREYVQHLFLSYFYQQPATSQIYFKGGTALRIIYKSPRFSEDLDFGSTLTDIHKIEEAVLETIIEIKREGISAEIIESKETTGGYLAIIDFSLLSNVIRLKIEISFRERELSGDIETIFGDFIPAYTINALSQEQLTGGKLNALLDRHKPRDFYDLYFMLHKDMITPQQKQVLKHALEIVEKTNINFDQELKQFLPQSHWQVIKDFKAVLERTLNNYI
jgi:predicted nucleotidyltransferase component of viral defense system